MAIAFEEAARYSPVLLDLVTQGWSPQVAARVWGAAWDGDFRGSVRLDLAEPHLLTPANRAPRGEHRLLPPGHAIQVSGEENHLDALLPFLRPEGECWAHATLHEVVEQTARATRTVVEVRLDGDRVGKLSPKMSGDLLPAIQHLAAEGHATVARALIKGNRLKAEVTLYALRAHELPHSWLGSPPAPAVASAPGASGRSAAADRCSVLGAAGMAVATGRVGAAARLGAGPVLAAGPRRLAVVAARLGVVRPGRPPRRALGRPGNNARPAG